MEKLNASVSCYEGSWGEPNRNILTDVCSFIVHLHLNRYPCRSYPAASKAARDDGYSPFLAATNSLKISAKLSFTLNGIS